MSRADRLAPALAGALALLLGLMILPSVLRPPQDQPQTSSAFSPDAPPDKNQPSVFSSFGAAGSGTAAGVEASPTTTTIPPTKKKSSACPYGFGDPPRQIESIYSPPCAPAFTGDNGGATAFGVTADAINVCYLAELTGTVTNDGEMKGPVAPTDSANMRTYKVLRDYFNSRYQFYGRQLHFFYPTNDNSQSGDAQARARADKAKDVDHCFAAIQETNPAASDELAKRGILHFTQAQTPEKWFGDHDPFIWSFTPSGSQDIRLGAEYYCKKLAHKPPSFTNDPILSRAKERKVGALVYNLPAYDNPGPTIKALLKSECNVDVDPIITYDLAADNVSGLATAIGAMQTSQVTTIFYLGDLISAVPFTQIAKSDNYFPEWFIPGFGGVDTGHIARNYDQDEWSHAFGFSLYEIPKPDEETECYKAYHEIDPNNDPDSGMCTYMWGDMVQLFGAMQNAGPKLTDDALKSALVNQPKLAPNPPWHMAGGYDLNDHTYPDWAAEIWWDRNAMGSDGQKGTYRWVRGGQRYTYGQWPTEDPEVFDDKASSIALAPV
ncbi:MAG TPA: hypothetical protein VHD87_07070 [Acidimicrobiales bacterium]|nr:hypothetical protein [Acidimicrobiales bacterium]